MDKVAFPSKPMFDVDTGLCRLKIFGCSSSFVFCCRIFLAGTRRQMKSIEFPILWDTDIKSKSTRTYPNYSDNISIYFAIFLHIWTYICLLIFGHICLLMMGPKYVLFGTDALGLAVLKCKTIQFQKFPNSWLSCFAIFSFSCTTSQLQRHEAAQHRTWAQVLDSAPSFFNAEFPARGKMWGSQVHAHFDLMQGQLLKSSRAAWSRTILGICKISNFSKPKA